MFCLPACQREASKWECVWCAVSVRNEIDQLLVSDHSNHSRCEAHERKGSNAIWCKPKHQIIATAKTTVWSMKRAHKSLNECHKTSRGDDNADASIPICNKRGRKRSHGRCSCTGRKVWWNLRETSAPDEHKRFCGVSLPCVGFTPNSTQIQFFGDFSRNFLIVFQWTLHSKRYNQRTLQCKAGLICISFLFLQTKWLKAIIRDGEKKKPTIANNNNYMHLC